MQLLQIGRTMPLVRYLLLTSVLWSAGVYGKDIIELVDADNEFHLKPLGK